MMPVYNRAIKFSLIFVYIGYLTEEKVPRETCCSTRTHYILISRQLVFALFFYGCACVHGVETTML
jgi:hypothetical protein